MIFFVGVFDRFCNVVMLAEVSFDVRHNLPLNVNVSVGFIASVNFSVTMCCRSGNALFFEKLTEIESMPINEFRQFPNIESHHCRASISTISVSVRSLMFKKRKCRCVLVSCRAR